MQHPVSDRRPRASLRVRLRLALAAAAGTLALLEAGLWLLHPLPPLPPSRQHRYLPSWTAIGPAPRTAQIDPGPLPGVTPGPVEQAFNRLGFLFAEERQRRASADEVRIAVIGGSTTECSMLAADKRWPAVLEQQLQTALQRPVTVLNLGISAQDTRTHLATTAHVVTDLDVDACVFLIGTNDLGIATSTQHPMLADDAFQAAPKLTRLAKEAWRQTQLGRHLHRWGERLQARRTTPYFQAAAAFQAGLPVRSEPLVATAAGLAHYRRNIVSLAGLCREHGIAVLFATQPCMFPPQPTAAQLRHYWGCHTGTHAIAVANFVALLDAVNATLLATCRERGYPCVDLASQMPKGFDCFYDQVHFNEPGARRVGELLAGPVRALLP